MTKIPGTLKYTKEPNMRLHFWEDLELLAVIESDQSAADSATHVKFKLYEITNSKPDCFRLEGPHPEGTSSLDQAYPYASGVIDGQGKLTVRFNEKTDQGITIYGQSFADYMNDAHEILRRLYSLAVETIPQIEEIVDTQSFNCAASGLVTTMSKGGSESCKEAEFPIKGYIGGTLCIIGIIITLTIYGVFVSPVLLGIGIYLTHLSIVEYAERMGKNSGSLIVIVTVAYLAMGASLLLWIFVLGVIGSAWVDKLLK